MSVNGGGQAVGPEKNAPVVTCLLFRCGCRLLGCEAHQAVRVLRTPRLVPLPSPAGLVVGVCNYRGRIIGVIDIRVLFGDDTESASSGEWMVILKGEDFVTGVIVDEVCGIEEVTETDMVSSTDSLSGLLLKKFSVNSRPVELLSVPTLLTLPSVRINQ